jgi:two-component system sensor histidine kinase KdpD
VSDDNRRDDERPNPDALLEEVASESGDATRRGKLRIFFGACPGVGKTYTMLSEARQLRRKEIDVVVGVVETHGREETMRLLQGLPRIPPRSVEYRGRTYQEFDLEAALERHPAVLLVDELAHTNLPGSVHEKRWQDVEDLLAAGIDVYTTLNVQHLESMADIVARTVKAPVRETVPDTLFQEASEVVLVDLPPDDLLQRLREGKVYVPGQAQRAMQFFFRKGNLLALRQLALRVTAERVDSQMLHYRTSIRSGGAGKGASESLLLCLGPRDRTPLVRAASRLAEALHARWQAVYVETPTLQRLPTHERSAILDTLRHAQDLGARTAVLSGSDPVPEIIAHARRYDLNRVVIGRGSRRGWRRLIPHRPFVRRIARRAPDLDIILLASVRPEPTPSERSPRDEPSGWHRWSRQGVWKGYGAALLACLVATLTAGAAVALFHGLHIKGLTFSNITMLYFFAVVAVAWRYGRGPATLAAVANVVALDYFYGFFHRHLGAAGVQDAVTFAVLLGVGLLVGQLTARARYQAKVAAHRERRVRELYALARDLAAAVTEEQVAVIGLRVLRMTFDARAVVILPMTGGRVRVFGDDDPEAAPIEMEIARWVLERGEPAGMTTNTLAGARCFYMPLRSKGEVRGVLVIQPRSQRRLRIPEERRQLETCATLMASTLERLQLVASSQETVLAVQTERLRASLLAVLSHDLRTPLAGIVSGTERLVSELPDGAAKSQGREVLERAHALTRMIDDLLEMERLQGGGGQLRRIWTGIREILNAALSEVELKDHPLRTEIAEDCLEIYVDPTLLRRVFINLLRNVVDHTPSGTPVTVQARVRDGECEIVVWDTGPGLGPGQEEAIFEKGVTGFPEGRDRRFGIGLALSRVIVEAHGGTLRARNRLGGGAEFILVLPRPSSTTGEDLPAAASSSTTASEGAPSAA